MFAMLSSKTTSELYSAFYDAQEDTSIGLFCCLLKVLHKDGVYSFVVVEIKMHVVIRVMWRRWSTSFEYIRSTAFNRFMPKVVIAVVPGWAVGGGHSLHVVCDLTLASKEHAILSKQMQM
jgi:naphthoate synthase